MDLRTNRNSFIIQL